MIRIIKKLILILAWQIPPALIVIGALCLIFGCTLNDFFLWAFICSFNFIIVDLIALWFVEEKKTQIKE